MFVLGTDGNLWLEAPGWQQTGRTWVDGNVSAFTPVSAGSLYVLGSDGNLWLESPGWMQSGRTWVDGNVRGFAAAGDGKLSQESHHPGGVPTLLRRAFKVATTEPGGPV
jgi:hypothetical protein